MLWKIFKVWKTAWKTAKLFYLHNIEETQKNENRQETQNDGRNTAKRQGKAANKKNNQTGKTCQAAWRPAVTIHKKSVLENVIFLFIMHKIRCFSKQGKAAKKQRIAKRYKYININGRESRKSDFAKWEKREKGKRKKSVLENRKISIACDCLLFVNHSSTAKKQTLVVFQNGKILHKIEIVINI